MKMCDRKWENSSLIPYANNSKEGKPCLALDFRTRA